MLKKVLFLSLFTIINLYGVNFGKIQLSGEANYEIEKIQKDGTNNGDEKDSEHDIDLDLKFSYPLNNEAEFVIKANDDDVNDENGSSFELETDQIYLTYQLESMSSQFGLQEITGPFFDEKNGDGLLFLKSFGTNVLALSYYINNTFSKADEVMQVALVGEVKFINYSLWYSAIENSEETSTEYGSEAMQISVYNQNKDFKYGISYTVLDSDSNTSRSLSKEQSQTTLFLRNEDKTLQYAVAYIITGEDGGNVALDEETDTEANYSLDEVGANDIIDGNSYYIMFSKMFAKTNSFTFEYFNGDGTTSAEELKLSYKSYLDKDAFYYISADQWTNTNEEESQKVEIGFNILF